MLSGLHLDKNTWTACETQQQRDGFLFARDSVKSKLAFLERNK
jgi:hypothetical protein